MELSNFFFQENNSEFRIEAWGDPLRDQVVVEGFQKVKEGVKFLIQRYEKFDLNKFKEDLKERGWFSKRPYELAQRYDGSIGFPVMALYHRYCENKGIDPDKLLEKAYPKDEPIASDWDYTLDHAEWQGTAFPKRWHRKEFEGLLESLTEINYHSLHTELSEMESTPDKAKELKKLRTKERSSELER